MNNKYFLLCLLLLLNFFASSSSSVEEGLNEEEYSEQNNAQEGGAIVHVPGDVDPVNVDMIARAQMDAQLGTLPSDYLQSLILVVILLILFGTLITKLRLV